MSAIADHWHGICDAFAAERERAGRVALVNETAFLPAALEIIEQPVSPTGRFTAYLLLAGLALAILWLAFGRIDVVASASGRLIPADNVKLVQPAQPGIVRTIYVRDNQHVRKGQPLVELDPTVSTAEAAQARKALETAELDAARARAILSALSGHGFVFSPPAGTPPDIVATQAQYARAELDNISATAALHGAERQAAIAAKGEAEVQAAKLAETLPLLDVQINAYEGLLAKGFVSKLKVVELRRQRLAAGKDRQMALQTMRKADAQIRSASDQVGQSSAEARMRILANLTRADTEAGLRREELTKAVQKSGLQRLVSPVDGTVTQLAVHTIGGVVEAAKPIMAIVPAGGALVAEVAILNKDVGFVRVGQPVAVKLAAFPFTRYGTVDGRIESISSDATSADKLGLVYIARVSIDRRMVQRSGKVALLSPGMEIIADIRTGRRSILSYLLSPIDEIRQDAIRER